jgi:selenide,water dikinase
VIPEAWEFAEMGILPAGMYRNRHFAQGQVQVGEGTDRDGADYKVPLWSQEALGSTGGVDQRVTMRAMRSEEWMQTMQDLLYDPQTSGGLLMAVDPEEAQQLLSDLKEAEKQPGNEGMKCAVIGTVGPYEGGKRILLI